MKNIAVFAHNLSVEYALTVTKGIIDFFKDKDVHVIITQTFQEHYKIGMFDYQFWATTKLLNTDNIDAFIIISGSYTTSCTPEEQTNFFKTYSKKPTVSISINPNLKDVYYTVTNCDKAYDDIIDHLKNEHGCKHIGFISALQTQSEEAIQRFKSYKKALKKHGLEFDESIVYDGKFTKGSILNLFPQVIKTKEDVKFDAVFCANDFSAFGAVMVLQELGLKIPEDVVVTGFDDCSQAAKEVVPLTTINQDVGAQGYGAAKTAYDLVTGKTSERMISVPARPVYRESCGCTSHDDNDVSKIGNVHTETRKYFDNANYNVSYFSLLDKIQSSQTLTRLYALVNTLFEEVNIKTFALVLYNEPVLVEKYETFTLPHEAVLAMAFDHPHNFSALNIGKSFDPYESILPEGFLDTSANNFVVNSIFFGEKQYGYMMYQQGNRIPSFYAVYMKIVSNAIARSYDYTKALETRIKLEQENKILQQSNTELNTVSKTDELTGVYNRRGFLHLGQQEINLALQRKTTGLIIFGDMDGLKSINDTYGHEAGDEAIKAEASILSQAFRVNDIIGRMGGDEFAIVCTGMKMSALEKKIEEITRLCAEWKTANKSPFTLSMSLGACEFNSEKFILQELLTEADIAQYLVKKEKHAERQS